MIEEGYHNKEYWQGITDELKIRIELRGKFLSKKEQYELLNLEKE